MNLKTLLQDLLSRSSGGTLMFSSADANAFIKSFTTQFISFIDSQNSILIDNVTIIDKVLQEGVFIVEGDINWSILTNNAGLEITFSVLGNNLRASARLTGNAQDSFTPKGLTGIDLTSVTGTFSYDEIYGIIDSEIEGVLVSKNNAKIKLLPVTKFLENGVVTKTIKSLNLIEADDNIIPLTNLSDIDFFLGVTSSDLDLPQSLSDTLGTVTNIKNWRYAYNSDGTDEIQEIFIHIATGVSWELIPGNLTFRDLSISVNVTNPKAPDNRIITPTIIGTVNLGDKVEIHAEISRSEENPEIWMFHIYGDSERPINIPSIPDMLSLGGITLSDLPQTISTLPGIVLKDLQVDFNASDIALQRFFIELSTDDKWIIFPGLLEIQNVELALELNKNDQGNLEITEGGIDATWSFQDVVMNVSAQAKTEYFDDNLETVRTWNLIGRLLTPLNFRNFLVAHISLPSNFPSIGLNSATVTINQSRKTFEFNGEIELQNEVLNATVLVDAEYGGVSIVGGFGDDRTFSFVDLTALFGFDLTAALPSEITETVLGNVGLKRFELEFDFLTGTVDRFTFVIGTENEISIIPNILTLTPTLVFEIIDPTSSNKRMNLDIYGQWEIGTSQVDVSISVFDKVIRAGLVNGKPIDVSALTSLLVPTSVTLPSLAIEGFDFTGEIAQSNYQLELHATTGFSLNLGITTLAINDITFFLDIEEGTLSQFNLTGGIEFVSIPLTISANYENSAWSFSGTTPLNKEISLESVFNDLKSSLSVLAGKDINSVLPDVIQGLTVSNLVLSYDAATQMTVFGLDLGDPLTIASGFDIDLISVDLKISSNGLESGSNVKMLGTFAGIDIVFKGYKGGSGFLFVGMTQADTKIPVGMLLQDLIEKFGSDVKIPSAIDSLMISTLRVLYETATGGFTFVCGLEAEIGSLNAMNTFRITVTKTTINNTTNHTIQISNQLDIYIDENDNDQFDDGEIKLTFDILFEQSNSDLLVAALYTNEGLPALNIKKLINAAAGSNIELPDLEISLKDIIYIYEKYNRQSSFLIGVDLDASLNLSGLPLVGKIFSGDLSASIEGFRVYYSSRIFTQDESNKINYLFTNDTFEGIPNQISQGLNLMGRLSLGKNSKEFSYVIGGGVSTGSTTNLDGPNTTTETSTPVSEPTDDADAELVTSDSTIKWFNLQKTFGPVHIERAGIEYRSDAQELLILLTGSMELGPLQLDLIGLGIGSKIKEFSPKFSLDGLGISLDTGSLSIKGSLIRMPLPNPQDFQFDGAIVITAPAFSFSAIGSYANFEGKTSLFIYGVLKIPIGGPIFFFLDGLAFGFGYNRSLLVPALDDILKFPLVSVALGGSDLDIKQVIKSLNKYIPPSIGEYWVAIGITFNSFKLIDSFALVTLSFGQGFELNMIGISTLVLPTPDAAEAINPIAQIQLAIRVGFNPTEGWLQVESRLTRNSYVISKDVRLTGGFAFYAWFKDQPNNGASEGDVVVTLGGYNPYFAVPDYYPQVPRLGLSWKLSNIIMVKGSMYFALTPNAMMAGGDLEMTLNGNFGPVKVFGWLNMGMHMIISWKPYFYDFRVYVHFKLKLCVDFFFFSLCLNIDISANLHIKGPEFGGVARLKIGPISVTVSFGSDGSKLKPIPWNNFRTSFLPEGAKGGISISPQSGLLKMITDSENKEVLVMNAVNLSILATSQIPIKRAYSVNNLIAIDSNAIDISSFGVGPVAVSPQDLKSDFKIKIIEDDGTVLMSDFGFKPITKNMSASMWGTKLRADVNDDRLIKNLLSGFEITPGTPPVGGVTGTLPKEVLQSSTEVADVSFNWVTVDYIPATSGQLQIIDSNRDDLANLLYPDLNITLESDFVNQFRATPFGLLK